MSSPAFSATWLPAAIARAAVVSHAAPSDHGGGRHRAPERPERPETPTLMTQEQVMRTGRHAEPEWSREQFDPTRDEVDSLSWLGFGTNA
jgi:hypothetical protein